jgi:hypothetical protein
MFDFCFNPKLVVNESDFRLRLRLLRFLEPKHVLSEV